MTSNASLLGASMLLVVLLAGYGYISITGFGQKKAQVAAVANPASVHCTQLGGIHETRETEAGQAGYCAFPDGQICEEWTLFREGVCLQP